MDSISIQQHTTHILFQLRVKELASNCRKKKKNQSEDERKARKTFFSVVIKFQTFPTPLCVYCECGALETFDNISSSTLTDTRGVVAFGMFYRIESSRFRSRGIDMAAIPTLSYLESEMCCRKRRNEISSALSSLMFTSHYRLHIVVGYSMLVKEEKN